MTELQSALDQVDKRYDACQGGYREIAAAILCQRNRALAALERLRGNDDECSADDCGYLPKDARAIVDAALAYTEGK